MGGLGSHYAPPKWCFDATAPNMKKKEGEDQFFHFGGTTAPYCQMAATTACHPLMLAESNSGQLCSLCHKKQLPLHPSTLPHPFRPHQERLDSCQWGELSFTVFSLAAALSKGLQCTAAQSTHLREPSAHLQGSHLLCG